MCVRIYIYTYTHILYMHIYLKTIIVFWESPQFEEICFVNNEQKQSSLVDL